MTCEDTVILADVTVEHETEKAILCNIDGEKIWIPKSQIQPDSEVFELGTEGFLVVSRWFAERENLD